MKIDYPKSLFNLRLKLNISQEELAKKLGVSFSTINRWETGKFEPTKLSKARLLNLLEKCNVVVEVKNDD